MERENKPVSFNPNKPEEAAMLKHIRRKQFSKYVKKLIAADMAEKEATRKQKEPDRSETISAEPDPPDVFEFEESPEVVEPAQDYGELLKQMKRERNKPSGPWMP